MDEREFEDLVREALMNWMQEQDADGCVIRHIVPFRETGLITSNKGLLIHLENGSEFQLTVVQSK